MWIINVVLTWALWKVADMYFMVDQRFLGWLCVVLSAFNGAVVMAEIF